MCIRYVVYMFSFGLKWVKTATLKFSVYIFLLKNRAKMMIGTIGFYHIIYFSYMKNFDKIIFSGFIRIILLTIYTLRIVRIENH